VELVGKERRGEERRGVLFFVERPV